MYFTVRYSTQDAVVDVTRAARFIPSVVIYYSRHISLIARTRGHREQGENHTQELYAHVYMYITIPCIVGGSTLQQRKICSRQ